MSSNSSAIVSRVLLVLSLSGLYLFLRPLQSSASPPASDPQATATPTAVVQPTVPRAPSAVGSLDKQHVVESRDTLWSLAVRYYGNGARYPMILRANDLPDNAILKPGTTLIIPVPTEPEKEIAPIVVGTPAAAPVPTLVAKVEGSLDSQVLPSGSPSSVEPKSSLTDSQTPALIATSDRMEPLVRYLVLFLNSLGVISLLGSLVLGAMSYDLYQRTQRFHQRMFIGDRIRVL